MEFILIYVFIGGLLGTLVCALDRKPLDTEIERAAVIFVYTLAWPLMVLTKLSVIIGRVWERDHGDRTAQEAGRSLERQTGNQEAPGAAERGPADHGKEAGPRSSD